MTQQNCQKDEATYSKVVGVVSFLVTETLHNSAVKGLQAVKHSPL